MKKFLHVLFIGLLAGSSVWASSKDRGQILVSVDGEEITAGDLEQAVASSPFATQFNTLDQNQQAGLRGDILKGMVSSKLLYVEARALGLDHSEAFRKDLSEFRNGLLYKTYMDRLRSRVTIPEDELKQIRQEFKGDSDAISAAKSNFISSAYKQLRDYTILALRDKYHVKIHTDKLENISNLSADEVLLEGDGLKISYGDVVDENKRRQGVTKDWLIERLFQRAELLLVAKEAESQNLDVAGQLESFARERLPALLMEQKVKQWVPDDGVLKAYFDKHPEIAHTPTLWHVGQLVLKDGNRAKELRAAIKRGASLFFLAGHYSSDPYGRKKNGDMGWVKEGKGFPQIEKALAKLKDGEVSDVIKTPLGYHIVTVLERRPGETRPFTGMEDRVKQMLVQEKMQHYIATLEARHDVEWKILKPVTSKTAQAGE